MVVDMTKLIYSHPTFRDYADLSAQGIKVISYGGGDLYMDEFEDFVEWVEENVGKDFDQYDYFHPAVLALNELAEHGTIRGIARGNALVDEDGLMEALAALIAREGGVVTGNPFSPTSQVGGVITEVSNFIKATTLTNFVDTFTGNSEKEAFSAWVKFEDGHEDILAAAGSITDLLRKILPNIR